MAVNLSVWESVEALETFVWNTVHARFYNAKASWFDKADEPHFVMWTIPAGHIPSLEEAEDAARTSAGPRRQRARLRLGASAAHQAVDGQEMRMIAGKLVATAGALVLATAALAHDTNRHGPAGEPGDPKRPARKIAVTASDAGGRMRFTPERIEVAKGDQILFVITNAGALAHEFVIGSKIGKRRACADDGGDAGHDAQRSQRRHRRPRPIRVSDLAVLVGRRL